MWHSWMPNAFSACVLPITNQWPRGYFHLEQFQCLLVQIGRALSITVIQVQAPTTNTKDAEVERFYEELQDLLTPTKDVLFIIGDWNAEVGSQEIPGITGKFGLGGQNEAGQT